jgi:hypothetical protein
MTGRVKQGKKTDRAMYGRKCIGVVGTAEEYRRTEKQGYVYKNRDMYDRKSTGGQNNTKELWN